MFSHVATLPGVSCIDIMLTSHRKSKQQRNHLPGGIMLSILLTLLSSSHLWAQGFSSGNNFSATELSGSLTIFCNDGRSSTVADVYCDGEILEPAEWDYFVTDDTVDADSVTLTNKIGKKTVSKTHKFSTDKNRSKTEFNLWIRTLTQTPLLGYGENVISYQLTKKKQVVKAGQFTVTVSANEARRCQRGALNSGNMDDCNINRNLACDRYFQYQNYCR
jgi:hypothetical protein